MKIDKFEDIQSWQESRKLATIIYNLFKNSKDFSFRDQICRATISISNNIAEWFERKTNKEFKQFLYIAKWSAWELRSMLYIALDLWCISQVDFDYISEKSIIISKQLSNFIKYLNDNS